MPARPSITPRWFETAMLIAAVLALASTIHLALVAVDLLPVSFVGTAFTAILLGACLGAVERWRTERGVWMLASLFALVAAALLGTVAWAVGRDLGRGATYSPLNAVDAGVALVLLTAAIVLLVYAAWWNWRLTRHGRPPPPPDAGSPVRSGPRPMPPVLAAHAQTDATEG